MSWAMKEKPAENWNELCNELFDAGTNDQLACRGQTRDFQNRRLYSSLDRILTSDGLSGPLHRAIERILIERFLQQAPNYLPLGEQSHLSDGTSLLMLMRHYGGPTRLLDWSESIWIAAFNAANGDWNCDGEIWVFDRAKFATEVHKTHGHEITEFLTDSATISGEASRLPAVTVVDLSEWVSLLFNLGPRIPRVIAQQGLFTIGSRLGLDHAELIDRTLPNEPACTKRIITVRAGLKARVLKELSKMGITAATLYPGIDGVGKYLDTFAHFARLEEGVKMMSSGAMGALLSQEHARKAKIVAEAIERPPEPASHIPAPYRVDSPSESSGTLK